jgi:hypothetical protein
MSEEATPSAEVKRGTKAAPKKPRSRLARVVRGVLFTLLTLVLLVVALVAGALFYLTTDSGKERVRALVERRLQERINGKVTLGSLDYELLGEVRLGALVIVDEDGKDAVTLEQLRVAPAWRELAGGEVIALDDVALKGLHVTLVKDADGSSNLKRLVKPQPEPAEPKKPFEKQIVVRRLTLENIDLDVESPDGTRISLSDLALEGHATATPSTKDVSLVLAPLSLGLHVTKPESQGGLKLGLSNLKTGLSVELVGGKGSAKLEPLTADVALAVPEKIDTSFPVAWDGISFELGGDDLGLSLDKLALGALSLASVQVRGHLADGSLSGEQAADVVGLKIDATQLSSLLGKPVLKSDLDLEAHLTGTANAPTIELAVLTKGGNAKLTAKLDLADKDNPKHDLQLELTDVDTTELLSTGVTVPPVKLASLTLSTRGQGRDAVGIKTTGSLKAKGLVVRGVTLDDIDADLGIEGSKIAITRLDVDALDQHVSANGTFERSSKTLDLKVALDGDVGVALAKLKAAGLPIKTELAAGLVKIPKDKLTIWAKGAVDGALDVTVKADALPLLGGKLSLDANAALLRGDVAKGEKAVTLKGFGLELSLDGVLLSSVLAARGKQLPPALGFDALLSLRAKGSGTLSDLLLDATLNAVTLRKDKGDRVAASVVAHITHDAATVELSVRDALKKADVVLDGRAHLPLALDGEKKGLDLVRPVDVHLALKRRPIGEVTKYVPPLLLAGRPIPRHGALELALDLTGSLSRPKANVHLFAGASVLEPDAPAPLQIVELDARLEPGDARSPAYKLAVDLSARLAADAPRLLGGKVTATFPYSPLAGGAAGVKYQGHLDLGPIELGALPNVQKLAKARALGGNVSGTVDVSGNRQDVLGSVALRAEGLGTAPGTIDASVNVDVKAKETSVKVDTALAGERLALLEGALGLGGVGLLPRIKQGLNPSLDLTLDVPKRKLASLSVLRPKLDGAPGVLSGNLRITGVLKDPRVSGGLSLGEIPMVDGTNGGAAVAITVDETGLLAKIGVGESVVADAPVQVAATVSHEDLFELVGPKGDIAVSVVAKADKADLRRLIPKQLIAASGLEPKGALDWDMKASLALERKDGKLAAEALSLDGALSLAGTLPIPGTKRSIENVALEISAAKNLVTIDRVHAEESDHQVKGRSLDVTGVVAFDKVKPKTADVTIQSDRWLLFGGSMLGKPDAPRGVLTLHAKAHAELDRPIKQATIEVDKLSLEVPDRFEKAHQPEDVHAGDVLFLNEQDVALGKLPVPTAVKEKAERERAEKERAAAPVAVAAAAPPPPSEPTGFDLDVHVAPGSRLFFSPIDVTTGGDLRVEIRPDGRKIRGKLSMTKGELSLGGKMHPLKEGSWVFDDAHPSGEVDLTFERQLPPWALRDVSEASAGTALRIHMTGPVSDRKTVLSGAGSPGALFDLLSMHNVGRERFYSEADLPESVAVEFPQHSGLLALSFISVNLPHLLFLDRVAAWADSFDGPRAYGRLEHYEAERYFADGKGRVRAAKRPAGIGRSEAELEVDYLFMNEPRVLFGVGATGGSRGGGGPSVVLEWSSKD